jgi:hypothetical protein
MKRRWLAIRQLTSPILTFTFPLLLFVGPTIPSILIKNKRNVIKIVNIGKAALLQCQTVGTRS